MAIELIPNQPYIFASPLLPQCLNNDSKAYAQMVTQGDVIALQQKMLPCTEDLLCEPTMVDEGAVGSIISGWTTTGGWSVPVGYDLDFDGTGGVVGRAYQSWGAGTLKAGNSYVVTFTISAVTGVCAVTIGLGLDVTTTVYSTPGTYSVMLTCQIDTNVFEIFMEGTATTAGDTMSITNTSIARYTTCWKDGLNFGYPSWNYVYETDGLTYYLAYYCSRDYTGGTLTNTSAYTTDNNYHVVELEIFNCTQGGLQVTLGGVVAGTTTGNGTFKFYVTPTDASGDLIFTKVDLFDGCLRNVSVSDYGDMASTHRFELDIVDSNNTVNTLPMYPSVERDRITWSFGVDELDDGSGSYALPCGMYTLRITDNCGGTIYNSITKFAHQDDWPCSYLFNASCTGDAFGFVFDDASGTNIFNLIQRLRVLQFNPKYKTKGDEYVDSSGLNTRPSLESQKVREAWFDKVDEATHDCIRVQLYCDRLLIEGYEYYCVTNDYEPEWAPNGKRNLAQSRVEMIKVDEKTLFNRFC